MEFEAPDWKLLYSSLSRKKRFAFCPVGYYLHHVAGRDGYAGVQDEWCYRVYAAKHILAGKSWCRALFRESVREFFTPGANFRKRKFENFLRAAFERKFTLLESGAYRVDPKTVNAVLEIEDHRWNTADFYEQALYWLNDWCSKFTAEKLFFELLKTPLLDFRIRGQNFYQWQLGGVVFYNPPELVWKNTGRLRVLDMNSYTFKQERDRAAMLYKVYICKFYSVSASDEDVLHYNLCTGTAETVENSDENFEDVFRKLSGEAAMWRDYLITQHCDCKSGKWNYARVDNCPECRFKEICPARHGTAINIDDSI
ncbi:MAG: hypothetical protein J6S19_01095 [Lentisphaeria bacterium]|nr:hypothetical protein [Lentisphaeria bacterium]